GGRDERSDRLYGQRSGRSGDCAGGKHCGVRQLSASSERAEQDEPDAADLSAAVQRGTDSASGREAVGDGDAVPEGRQSDLQSRGGHGGAVWTLPAEDGGLREIPGSEKNPSVGRASARAVVRSRWQSVRREIGLMRVTLILRV